MWRFAIIFLVTLTVALPAQAKPGKANKHSKKHAVQSKQEISPEMEFSPAERNMIRSHLLSKQQRNKQKADKALPPGLQKKVARGKALPPGWQKKVAQGESLDYQVYRQGKSLPDPLLQRLPPSPVGSEIIRVENEIIRLNSATRMILDVFNLAPAN